MEAVCNPLQRPSGSVGHCTPADQPLHKFGAIRAGLARVFDTWQFGTASLAQRSGDSVSRLDKFEAADVRGFGA